MGWLKDAVNRPFHRFTPFRLGRRGITRRERWSIGVYRGAPPASFRPHAGVANPVLTYRDVNDIRAEFVADPFIIAHHGRLLMFFEGFNAQDNRGEVALAESRNGVDWTYVGRVLVEPFHMSFPFVFSNEGNYYLMPETRTLGEIRLYRAIHFPHDWEFLTTLLIGHPFGDSVLLKHDNTWWIFTEASETQESDTLRLFFADDIFGPWTEHPQSPIVNRDARYARPAGRIVATGGRLYRYAQDCSRMYGESVHVIEILTLTRSSYREQLLADNVLAPGRSRWHSTRMHHIDVHPLSDTTWIALVDGHS